MAVTNPALLWFNFQGLPVYQKLRRFSASCDMAKSSHITSSDIQLRKIQLKV